VFCAYNANIVGAAILLCVQGVAEARYVSSGENVSVWSVPGQDENILIRHSDAAAALAEYGSIERRAAADTPQSPIVTPQTANLAMVVASVVAVGVSLVVLVRELVEENG
jgi:hypothetical protein